MSLFDYPKTYPSQIEGSVSRTARLWCVGGLLWLAAAMLLYMGSAYRIGFPGGFFMQNAWANAGVLNQMAEYTLIYGWGVSMVMGTALLQICRNSKAPLSPLAKAGGWVWHGGVFGGLIVLGSLSGSGIEGMAYPVWLWIILILGILPTFGSLTGRFVTEEQGFAEKLLYMAVLTGILILLFGTVFVFYGAVEAFYRGLAAQAVRASIVLCLLFGASWGFFLFKEEFSMKKRIFIGILFVLFIITGLVFELAKDGMIFSRVGRFIQPLAWFFFCCSIGLVLARFFFKKGQNRYSFINFYFAIYLAYIIMGKYRGGLPLFSIILGILTMGVFVPLYHLIPRCAGGDWPSVVKFRKTLLLASLLWGGGLVYDGAYVFFLKRAHDWGYPVDIVAWGTILLALLGLVMAALLIFQVAALWFAGGFKNAVLSSFPFDKLMGDKKEIIKEKGGSNEG